MRQVICHGSCRVCGHQTSSPPLTAWPGQLGLALGDSWRVICNGIGSMSLRELDVHAATTVDPLISDEHEWNVLLLDEITNTLAAHERGVIVAGVIADLRAYCANRRFAAAQRGAKLRIGVMLCPACAPPQRELFRREVNSVLMMLGPRSGGWDMLFADDRMTDHESYRDATLYNPDGLHPSEHGHVLIAQAARGAVLAMTTEGEEEVRR